jgi:Zn-dependent metalloprotease
VQKFVSIFLLAATSVQANQTNSGGIQLPRPINLDASIQRLGKAFQDIQKLPQIQLKLSNPSTHSLILRQRIEGAGIETTKFQHFFKGIEVMGSGAFHHDIRGAVDISNHVADFDLKTEPTIAPENAVSIAQGAAGDRTLKSAPVLKVLPDGKGAARLVYLIKLNSIGLQPGRKVLLDAHSGEIIANTSFELTLAPVHVHTTAGRSTPLDTTNITSIEQVPAELKDDCQVTDLESGIPLIINLKACEQVVTAGKAGATADSAAKEAATNAAQVLKYYSTTHGRDSFDGSGAALTSLVHVGRQFANAFWNTEESFMGYGDGDGLESGSYTRALDVAGHEMTHGLVQNTANLGDFGEPGALNEAYADFFGVMISGNQTWQIGAGLSLDPKAAEPVRDLANPTAHIALQIPYQGRVLTVYYPAHKNGMLPTEGLKCGPANDNCFVHINATLPGHASYLIAQAIGRPKAEKLYYTVMTQYLRETSTFADSFAATRQVCPKLFDVITCAQVNKAIETVGF